MIIKKLKQIFLYAGCKTEKEFQSILPEIHKSNTKILKPMSGVITFVIIVLYFLAFKNIILEYSINIYSMYSFLFGMSSISIWMSSDNKNSPFFLILYIFITIVYSFGIINDMIIGYDKQAVSFIAILIVTPVLYIDRPIRMYLTSILAMILFILFAIGTKNSDILRMDIVNVIIFGIIGMIISYHTTKIQTQALVTKKRMEIMSELDSLTGLKNRNSLAQNVKKYEKSQSQNLACIYVDANGLYKINNTVGHEAGDKMLVEIASIMKKIFHNSDIYRLGGDEYIAIQADVIEDRLKENIQNLIVEVSEQGYSVSVGSYIQEAPNFNINRLINDAENEMCRFKHDYYVNSGVDRRKRRFVTFTTKSFMNNMINDTANESSCINECDNECDNEF